MPQNNSPKITAILLAAGSSRRMHGICKQLYLLSGEPVIVRTLRQFVASPQITEIVLVCQEHLIAGIQTMAQEYIDFPFQVVAGGNTRQESVFAGVAAASADSDLFAIHDGARPLVQPQDIENCIAIAMQSGAAALGVRVKETIKIVGEEMEILSTPERSALYTIQTPQIFAAELYRAAMQKAIRDNQDYTDDCQLIEHCGKRVYVCLGSYENIKITTPEDLVVAEAILERRKTYDTDRSRL